jgi:hypothetical protein
MTPTLLKGTVMENELDELMKELGKVTEAIGRRIASPKNDLEDIEFLITAVEHVATTLKTVHSVKVLQAK